MTAQVGTHALQGLLDPGPDVVGVQVVDKQQAGNQIVAGQGVEHLVVESTGLVHDRQNPLQPGAVQVGHQPDQFLGALPRHDPAGRTCLQQRVDPVPGGPEIRRRARGPWGSRYSATYSVGECIRSSFLPPPRYMCTPHGRHGSKLRTVRMMSMPLKCSRSFSSKIG